MTLPLPKQTKKRKQKLIICMAHNSSRNSPVKGLINNRDMLKRVKSRPEGNKIFSH